VTLLLTSIPPALRRTDATGGEIGARYQKQCVDSWVDAGFEPCSVHAAAELGSVSGRLQELGIGWATVEGDASGVVGRPLVHLADVVGVGLESGASVICIVNADVAIEAATDFGARASRLDPGQAWVGRRHDYPPGRPDRSVPFEAGFDFFAIHRHDLAGLDCGDLVFGQPWWDYALPLLLAARGVHLSQPPGAHFTHMTHPIAWRSDLWERFGWMCHELMGRTPAGSAEGSILDHLEHGPGSWIAEWGARLDAAIHLRDVGEFRTRRRTMQRFAAATLQRIEEELGEAVPGGAGRPGHGSPAGLVQVRELTGHRANYRDLLAADLGYRRMTGRIWSGGVWRLLSSPHAVFATIDDEPGSFVALATLRALLGRRTTGIYLRPHSCIAAWATGPWRLKRTLFRMLRRLARVQVLSIIPFDLRPELAEICDDWICDPEHWDVVTRRTWTGLPRSGLSERVERAAGGRSIVALPGWIGSRKGVDDLELQWMALREAERPLVVIAGPVEDDARACVERLRQSGAFVEDRRLADDELFSLYGIATAVWCRYAPDYDQSSGVFGRALQFGVPAIVREGSLLEDWARAEGAVVWHRLAEIGGAEVARAESFRLAGPQAQDTGAGTDSGASALAGEAARSRAEQHRSRAHAVLLRGRR
jgi:hypothetical protein